MWSSHCCHKSWRDNLVVRTHHAGKLVKPGNSEALAQAILHVYSHLDTYKKKLLERIVNSYDLNVLTEKLQSLYSRLVSEFRRNKINATKIMKRLLH